MLPGNLPDQLQKTFVCSVKALGGLASDIDRKINLAGNLAECVLGGIRPELSECDRQIVTIPLRFAPEMVHFHDQFGSCRDRVATQPARRGTRMRVAAEATCRSVSEGTPDAGDNSHRHSFRDQARPLFNVRLDEEPDIGRAKPGFAPDQPVNIAPCGGNGVAQRRFVGCAVDPGQFPSRKLAEGSAAADVGGREPGAFLGTDCHQRDVTWRLHAGGGEPGDYGQSAENTGRTVKIAAARNGIEMGADDDAFAGIPAGQGQVQIACRIGLDPEPHPFTLTPKEIMTNLLPDTV